MMKLLKKTAALLFCLTLALSVMAVTAWADDEATLLNGLAEPVPNSKFEVTLVKAASTDTTFTNDASHLTAVMTDNILDRDATTVNGYEVNKADSVTFKIMLAYHGNTFTPYDPTTEEGNKISGFQFTYDPGTKEDTNSNKGVTITGLTIGNQDVLPVRNASTAGTTYASGSLGSESNDIGMPGSTAVMIGTVTFSFNGALQENTPLTPTITGMQVFVRNETHPQLLVKVKNSSGTVITPTDGDYSNLSEYASGGNFSISDGGGGSTSVTYNEATATTDKPIYVNPYYEVTVEHFQANANTGIAEKITDSNVPDTVEEADKAEYIRSTVRYYFDTNAIPADQQATANKLPNEKPIPGYTFQGWMVTQNNDGTNLSATWDAYANSDGSWSKTTSYKVRVTSVPSGADASSWATTEAVSAWDATNEATTPALYVNFDSRTTAIENTPTGVGVEGVKFITVGNQDVTSIPGGYVGPITLTPVYTRDVYAVRFSADNFETNTGSKAYFANNGATVQSSENKTYTDYYTIENLANGTAVNDYLDIAYGVNAPYVHGENENLKKPGYKFVGWVPSGDGTSSDTGYAWTTDATTRVNSVPVIRTAPMKRYGSLTLTAEWEPDIYFAKVNYWYAGTANSLILVAVPNASYQDTYTYKCESKNASGDTTDFAMFEIPSAKPQRQTYINAAIDVASGDVTVTGANTITAALFGVGDDNNDSGTYHTAGYHLFAYIAKTSDTDENDITLEESASTSNTSIAYDGDVDGSLTFSIADFGNVDSLLNDATDTTANIFAITSREGVEARLEADMSTAIDALDPTGEAARAFASIKDVKDVYNVMGYNAT